jgi:type IV pilus assembly protein PilA
MSILSTSKKERGFTLIELLVVIAIIGILSAVVLASLNSARTKGADAAVKSNLNGTRSQSELYYDSNGGSYASICTNTTVGGVKSVYSQVLEAGESIGITSVTRNGTGSATVAVCNDSAALWAAQVPLKAGNGNFYCVDSTGLAVTVAATTSRITGGTDYSCN